MITYNLNGEEIKIDEKGIITLKGKQFSNILNESSTRWVGVYKAFDVGYLGVEIIDGVLSMSMIKKTIGDKLTQVDSAPSSSVTSQLAELESCNDGIGNTSPTIYNRRHDFFACIIKTPHTRRVLNVAIQVSSARLKFYEDGKANGARYLRLEDASTERSPNLRAKAVGDSLTFLLFRSEASTEYFIVCIEEDTKAASACESLEAALSSPSINHHPNDIWDEKDGRADKGDRAEDEALRYMKSLDDIK